MMNKITLHWFVGLVLAAAVGVALSLRGSFVRKLRTKPMLDAASLKRQVDAGTDLLLLDVRPPSDFSGEWGHIPGARSLPLEELPERLAELGDHRRRPIRLVCRTDRRSTQAARLLAEAGFTGHGKFNFLLSDGEHLIAYGHDRLHYLESTDSGDETVLIATEPPSGGAGWAPFDAGELRIYRAGLRVSRISTRPPPARTNPWVDAA